MLLVTTLTLTLLAVAWRRVRPRLTLPAIAVVLLVVLGGALGLACAHVEALLWSVSGLSLMPRGESATAALLAMLLFAAPLEEGSKLFAVWSIHHFGRLRERADAVLAAIALAAGFAITESFAYLLEPALPALSWLRAPLGALAQIFFASVWGFVLGTRSKLHLLGLTWFVCTMMHGLYDHVVFGRGQGTLVVAVPSLLMMLVVGWLLLAEVRQGEVWVPREAAGLAPPSLRDLTRALRRREQPLMVLWIVIGTLVTTGVVLASLALAVLVGHEMGVDFAAADEGDMRANGPLTLLGGAVLVAFPIAGYLVARASGSHSVLEAAMGAAFAIAAVVALLSLAAPVAVVFALAVAPVAFGLACLGAWFGVGR